MPATRVARLDARVGPDCAVVVDPTDPVRCDPSDTCIAIAFSATDGLWFIEALGTAEPCRPSTPASERPPSRPFRWTEADDAHSPASSARESTPVERKSPPIHAASERRSVASTAASPRLARAASMGHCDARRPARPAR